MTARTSRHLYPLAPPRSQRGLFVFAAFAVLFAVGCSQQEELETYYGRHRFPGQWGSINGTDVLAQLFEDAGHSVHFRRSLVTDDMIDADVVVWFPNDPEPPSEEVCQWFDQWLSEFPDRTLVYVGRDYDALEDYRQFLANRRAKDSGKTDAKPVPRLPELPASSKDDEEPTTSCEWFTYEKKPAEKVSTLSGPWANNIDAEQSGLELRTRMLPKVGSHRLLWSNGDILVSRYTKPYWEGSQILLVANGSFLLNVPLVNHENRKLAAKLIEETGEPVEVVFLESARGGPPIDPPYTDNSLWTLFRGWPLGAILLQLALVGVVFCFARWPIFGRPRQSPPETTSDFTKHIAAVGRLLARTKELPPDIGGAHGHDSSSSTTSNKPTKTTETLPESRPQIASRPPAIPAEPRGN